MAGEPRLADDYGAINAALKDIEQQKARRFASDIGNDTELNPAGVRRPPDDWMVEYTQINVLARDRIHYYAAQPYLNPQGYSDPAKQTWAREMNGMIYAARLWRRIHAAA